MKKPLIITSLIIAASIGLAGCGSFATTPSTQTTGASIKSDKVMTIVPGLKLGPDGKMHDTFSPSDLTVVEGVPTTVTVLNYDDGAHDIVAKDLKLNVKISGSEKKGVPSETTFTLTADKTGDFHWYCDIKCDGEANGWAMKNDGYMAGTIHVVAPSNKSDVAMTILPGRKLGPDGKMHDIFSTADLKLKKGVPTTVTVYNYDDGAHDFVAKDLNLNVKISGSEKKGVPSVTTFTVTPDKTGDFHWYCDIKCDGEANGWAMKNNGYMAGTINVQ